MKSGFLAACLAAAALILFALPSLAAEGDYEEDGKYMTRDDVPTYRILEDGTVDWYTYSGFRRYHSECHVCHGPDGLGSTYAPALADSMKTLSYDDYMEIVINGRQDLGAGKESVMPAFGINVNVTCYIDDIYVYLKARADDAVPRGRPPKRADKPETAKQDENDCRDAS